MGTGKKPSYPRTTGIAVTGYLLAAALLFGVLIALAGCAPTSYLAPHERIVSNLDPILDVEESFELVVDRIGLYRSLLDKDEREALKYHMDVYYTYYHAAYDALASDDLQRYREAITRLSAEIGNMHDILDSVRVPNHGPTRWPLYEDLLPSGYYFDPCTCKWCACTVECVDPSTCTKADWGEPWTNSTSIGTDSHPLEIP